jgi:hypothetical protein
MRALFKILSLIRTAKAASRGKLAQRYMRIKTIRLVNRKIR